MAAVETVMTALHTLIGGDATAMDDHYRNETTKFTAGTLYYQLRGNLSQLLILANDTLEILIIELEFFYKRPQAEAEPA